LTGIPKDVLESGIVADVWKEYPPQHPLLTIGLVFVIACLWVLNFLSNGSVLYAYLRDPDLKKNPVNRICKFMLL